MGNKNFPGWGLDDDVVEDLGYEVPGKNGGFVAPGRTLSFGGAVKSKIEGNLFSEGFGEQLAKLYTQTCSRAIKQSAEQTTKRRK